MVFLFFFSFFFDFRNIAFAGLSLGDSIWIGLSVGFGESCLSHGLERRLGVPSARDTTKLNRLDT